MNKKVKENGLIINRQPLFQEDIQGLTDKLTDIVTSSRFLVIGGGGSIGQAVVKELFDRNPKVLHVVDISENNLVELVRDLRSSVGYTTGVFDTFALDVGSVEFTRFLSDQKGYDYVMNLSALKHVRSEKDPYTLMRMINTNVLNTIKLLKALRNSDIKNYFSVSTDKAANPVNLMGASKRAMEMVLMLESEQVKISMARFANVAFSDGSLLHGFQKRVEKNQPISAPKDIHRYFITPEESGQLCLMSSLFSENRDIFFPKLTPEFQPITFSQLAVRYLNSLGIEAEECETEMEARNKMLSRKDGEPWPCYFFCSDTTGEKGLEEFYSTDETLDNMRFKGIGVIKNLNTVNTEEISRFLDGISRIQLSNTWVKADIVREFKKLIPNFLHQEVGKNLNEKM